MNVQSTQFTPILKKKKQKITAYYSNPVIFFQAAKLLNIWFHLRSSQTYLEEIESVLTVFY